MKHGSSLLAISLSTLMIMSISVVPRQLQNLISNDELEEKEDYPVG
jgi:hypothetical protein